MIGILIALSVFALCVFACVHVCYVFLYVCSNMYEHTCPVHICVEVKGCHDVFFDHSPFMLRQGLTLESH